MKILLVGEYSRLHNSLKEGLVALGHTVNILSTGDAFKKYDSDFTIAPKVVNSNFIFKKAGNLIFKIAGIHPEDVEKGLRLHKILPQLKGYDHVQFINSDALHLHPLLAKKIYKKLLKNNGSMSLLVCGDDTPVIDYCLTGNLKYSILTPYLKNKSLKNYFKYSLKYTTNNYRSLFNWVKNNASAIITSDLDYEIPLAATGISTHFIPNPVNTDVINFKPLKITDKIIIFLGINRLSYVKKGISYFEEALKIIAATYPDKVEVIISENRPYKEYITLYNNAHIVLDQVYAYDQGYNALEAMAKGKVVFTGAETEFTTHYKLTERVAINALPNVEALVEELSYLINNPDEIIAIGKRARDFVEKQHYYITIAGNYLKAWNKS